MKPVLVVSERDIVCLQLLVPQGASITFIPNLKPNLPNNRASRGIVPGKSEVFELANEAGIPIETGPARHGIGGASFLYILELGGNRIELMGDLGYMIFDPAWRTVVWKGSEVPIVGAVWTDSSFPNSFWNYGTPLPEDRAATWEAAAA